MKADLRISVKDNRRGKNLKILLRRTQFPTRQFFVRMDGQPWPRDGRPVRLDLPPFSSSLASYRRGRETTGEVEIGFKLR
jgi:hypothetical protein